jgi:Mid2 like cell wall stress sensor
MTFASTTYIPTTLIPGLQENTGGGLSNDSKKIVIGVIVGVGGAALLAGIAVVLWRHNKREKDNSPDNTNLTYFGDDPAEGYGGAPTEGVVGEKTAQGTEFHRAPVVNAASNF